MGFSEEWDHIYKQGQHLSIWPWSDLVSLVMRHARPRGESFRVLELGCGAGANISFFANLNAQYHAVEGSPSIVEKLRNTFPQYQKTIVAGDFTKELFFNEPFDLIVDRAAITHNTTVSIQTTLLNLKGLLKKDGKFIGIDWFSTSHSDYILGEHLDEYTKTNMPKGQFIGLGAVHFSDKSHLMDLMSDFTFRVLDHKVVRNELSDDPQSNQFASWNFVTQLK